MSFPPPFYLESQIREAAELDTNREKIAYDRCANRKQSHIFCAAHKNAYSTGMREPERNR
jgi:hypothetical protein